MLDVTPEEAAQAEVEVAPEEAVEAGIASEVEPEPAPAPVEAPRVVDIASLVAEDPAQIAAPPEKPKRGWWRR